MATLKQCLPWVIPVALILVACSGKKNIPFPGEQEEYATPVTKKFAFGKAKNISWDTVRLGTVSPKVFDLDKISARPFYLDGFQPLLKPLNQISFNWDSLPAKAFDWDTLTQKPLHYKTMLLLPPLITTAKLPELRQGSTEGILQFDTYGLPGLPVSSVLQDRAGLIWMITPKGLSYFDGENLENYAYSFSRAGLPVEDSLGQVWIPDNNGIHVFNRKSRTLKQITFPGVELLTGASIVQLSDGLLWVSCFAFNGVYIIDPIKETWRQLNTQTGLSSNGIYRAMEDIEGLVWLGKLNHGIDIIDRKAGRILNLGKEVGLPLDSTSDLMEEAGGKIWIDLQTNGIALLNKREGSIIHLGKDQGMPPDFAVSLVKSDKGQIYTGTFGNGVHVFDPHANAIKHLGAREGLTDSFSILLLKDNQHQVWVQSLNMLGIIDTKSPVIRHLTNSSGLGDSNIWDIMQDKTERIWLGTYNGIDVIDPNKKTIRHIGVAEGISPARINNILMDDQDNIWIAGYGNGVYIVDQNRKTIKHIGAEQGLMNETVAGLIKDHNQQIWLTTFSGEIYVIDPKNQLVSKVSNCPEFGNSPINELWENKEGNMLLSVRGKGVAMIDAARKTVRTLTAADGLISNNVTSIMENSIGQLWIGTEEGISVADTKKGLLSELTTREGLAGPGVYVITEKDGHIYAGTSKGITVLTPEHKGAGEDQHSGPNRWSARSYGKFQGLTAVDVNQGAYLFLEGGRSLWGIEQTLTLLDSLPAGNNDSNTHKSYITALYLSDKQQNFQTMLALQQKMSLKDTVWDHSRNGFYTRDNLPADTSYLQKHDVRWDDTQGPFNMPVNLRLPHTENYLSFSFTGAQLKNRDKISYRYILEGIDNQWSEITSEPYSENYRDLPPGNYIFKVRSRNFEGSWGPPAELTFTILHPWWQSWWATLLYIALFALVVWSIVNYRSRWLKEENQRLEEMVKLRTHELSESINDLKTTQSQLIQSEKMASLGELTAGIAHEIQNPLNFVNNFSEVNTELIEELKTELEARNLENAIAIAQDISLNEQKINHHGKRAEAIVKGMLQHSRSSNGVKEPTDINALTDEYLRLAYHGLRAKDKTFNATIKTEYDEKLSAKESDAGKVMVIPQDIGRVILNLITNAFYAANEKKRLGVAGYEPTVTVTTKKSQNKVEISIADNGNGIPAKVLDKIFQPFFTTKPAGQGTGLGLSMSYDIITKGHAGEFKVETKEGDGSVFIISLPV